MLLAELLCLSGISFSWHLLFSNGIGHIICQHVLRTPNKGVMGVSVKGTWYNGAARRLQVVAVTITNPSHLSSSR
jgi:hypothetical protein